MLSCDDDVDDDDCLWILLEQQVGVRNKTQKFGSTVGVAAPSSAMFIFVFATVILVFSVPKTNNKRPLATLSPCPLKDRSRSRLRGQTKQNKFG